MGVLRWRYKELCPRDLDLTQSWWWEIVHDGGLLNKVTQYRVHEVAKISLKGRYQSRRFNTCLDRVLCLLCDEPSLQNFAKSGFMEIVCKNCGIGLKFSMCCKILMWYTNSKPQLHGFYIQLSYVHVWIQIKKNVHDAPAWQHVTFVSSEGLVSNRRQAITWISGDQYICYK